MHGSDSERDVPADAEPGDCYEAAMAAMLYRAVKLRAGQRDGHMGEGVECVGVHWRAGRSGSDSKVTPTVFWCVGKLLAVCPVSVVAHASHCCVRALC